MSFNSLAGFLGALGSQPALHCAHCGCTHDGFHDVPGHCFATNGATVWEPNAVEMQALAVDAQAVQETSLRNARSMRRNQVLGAFDWNRHNDLQYLGAFFAQWGWEPLEVPQEVS